MKSVELFERSKRVAPGGVHSPVRSFAGLDRAPVFFQSAKGAYITSVEGKQYIDYCQSFGPLILGHGDSEVKEAAAKMMENGWSFGACEPYSLELAEWLTKRISGLEKVRFVSSGTEAVMSALRVARGVTGRSLVLKFEGCYHGHVDSLLVKAGSGLAGQSAASSAGVSTAVAQETLTIPLDDEEKLERVFQERGSELAAAIVEPLPANYGLLIQRPEFLKTLQMLCKKYGALLIFDEVISGFRVSMGGMAEILGITPDLFTYGKVIGGGFPVGCYGGLAKYMDYVAPVGPVYQAGTLSANPVGMVAGLTTLKKMERENGWKVINERMAYLANGLSSIFSKSSACALEITSFSSLFWVHPKSKTPIRAVEQISSELKARFKPLFLELLERGVYLAPNAYEVGFLSLAHTKEILDLTLNHFEEALRSLEVQP